MSMNTCVRIKNEYESLKALKQDFVLACEKSGDLRALSSQQLTELQALKRILEQRRDALEDKIENKEVKTLKRMLEAVTSAVIADKNSVHDGKSIAEYVAEEDFQESVVDRIKNLMTEVGPFNGHSAWAAVVESVAALSSGLLNDDREAIVREYMRDQNLKNIIFKYITDDVTSGATSGEPGWYAVTGLNAASYLGLLTHDESDGILRQMHIKSFQEKLGQMMVDEVSTGRGDGFFAA